MYREHFRTGTIHLRDVPGDLRDRLKSMSHATDRPERELIIAAMDAFLWSSAE